MTRNARRPIDRGTTLLEAVIALSILLVGILGMMQLQILAITSTAGARAHSQALQVAHQLAAALEQLPVTDPHFTTVHFTGAAPPAEFGSVLAGPNSLRTSGFTPYDDGARVAGAPTDAELIAAYGVDPENGALPRFQRRWQVWQMDTASATGQVMGLAVSVTYREQRMPGLREVVLLTHVANRGVFAAYAGAGR